MDRPTPGAWSSTAAGAWSAHGPSDRHDGTTPAHGGWPEVPDVTDADRPPPAVRAHTDCRAVVSLRVDGQRAAGAHAMLDPREQRKGGFGAFVDREEERHFLRIAEEARAAQADGDGGARKTAPDDVRAVPVAAQAASDRRDA